MVAFDFESKIASIPDYPEPGVVFKDITPLLADGEGFSAVIDAIADHFKDLAEPINAFFDAVMVMADDEKIRKNRLALLKGVDDLLREVADFSKIVQA